MARLSNLLAFSGILGDVVGCNGPTGFYIRSRPQRSEKAPSAKQQQVRSRLAVVMRFLKPLKEIIYVGFAQAHPSRSRTTAMNTAASHMLNYAVEGSFPDITINPAAVRLSRGTLAALPDAGYEQIGSAVTVTWSPLFATFSGHADDVVTAVCYNLKEQSVLVSTALRSDEMAVLDLAELPPNSTSLIYVLAADRDRKQFSNSQFLGKIEQ